MTMILLIPDKMRTLTLLIFGAFMSAIYAAEPDLDDFVAVADDQWTFVGRESQAIFVPWGTSSAFAWSVCVFAEEDASQISFSDLEAQAVELVEKGSLQDAQPLLMELIKRVEATDNTTIQLDLPYFYTALAHFQNYAESKQKSELESSLTWLSRLVEKYPESSRLKEALLQKITVLRILGKSKEAIDLMVGIISKEYTIQLSILEEIQMLKGLTQTYYNSPNWLEGLNVYRKLLAMARTAEDKNYAAPAHQSFLRNERKRCKNANVDRDLRLSARGDHEKAVEHRAVALHNFTDFECVRFGENAAFAGISERGPLGRSWRLL